MCNRYRPKSFVELLSVYNICPEEAIAYAQNRAKTMLQTKWPMEVFDKRKQKPIGIMTGNKITHDRNQTINKGFESEVFMSDSVEYYKRSYSYL